MAKARRTDDEKRRASKNLHYEVTMLTAIAQRIATGAVRERFVSNALLESFLMHARGLLDFLYDKKTWPDDMPASDYSAQWARPELPTLAPELQEINSRVGKEIAHLTYARLATPEPEDRRWNVPAILREMGALLDQFLKTVPDDLLCNELRDYKRQRALTSERPSDTPT